MDPHRHDQRQSGRAPGDERAAVDQLAVDHRQDQAEREAGHCLDQQYYQEVERLLVGKGGNRAQQEGTAPAAQLQVPEGPVLVGEEGRRLDGQDRHCGEPIAHLRLATPDATL